AGDQRRPGPVRRATVLPARAGGRAAGAVAQPAGGPGPGDRGRPRLPARPRLGRCARALTRPGGEGRPTTPEGPPETPSPDRARLSRRRPPPGAGPPVAAAGR